jgi:hypothetical protein
MKKMNTKTRLAAAALFAVGCLAIYLACRAAAEFLEFFQ